MLDARPVTHTYTVTYIEPLLSSAQHLTKMGIVIGFGFRIIIFFPLYLTRNVN